VPAVTRVPPEQAEEIALAHYGVRGSAERLAAEHDDTFRIVTRAGTSRLLKIGVTDTAPDTVSFQTAILLHLAAAAPRLPVQRVTATLSGAPEARILDHGPARLARMTSWLDGEPLGRSPVSAALRRDLGAILARLNVALRGLRHPGERRTHLWDLQNFGQLRPLLGELPGSGLLPEVSRRLPAGNTAAGLRAALTGCLDRFDAVVRPALAATPVQVIHTDFHGDNLLVGDRVTGVLDFGDSLAGPIAMDVAVAARYQFGGTPDPLAPALDVVTGYHAVNPLGDGELPLIGEFMLLRIATRIIVSQWNAARDPANREYLLRRTPQAIEHFGLLRAIPPDVVENRIRAALEKS
jgi:hydroxylysine kinase